MLWPSKDDKGGTPVEDNVDSAHKRRYNVLLWGKASECRAMLTEEGGGGGGSRVSHFYTFLS